MGNKKSQTSPGWILILIFIFIMAATVGIIIYNQTNQHKVIIPNKEYNSTNTSSANGNYKPPTICNSSDRWQNNTLCTNITNISII